MEEYTPLDDRTSILGRYWVGRWVGRLVGRCMYEGMWPEELYEDSTSVFLVVMIFSRRFETYMDIC